MTSVETPTQKTIKIKELRTLIDVELGPSKVQTISQERINLFAEATGDWQWIHTDPEKAKDSPFGSTIAHGFLVLSLIAGINQDLLQITDAKNRLNYGLDRVRFPASLPVDSLVHGYTTLRSVQSVSKGIQLKFEVRVQAVGQTKPVCIAEFISLISGERLDTED